MKRIAVKAELEIEGNVSIPKIAQRLSQSDLVEGHPGIESVDFSSLPHTNALMVQLIVSGDSYAEAEKITENFLHSIDKYILDLPRENDSHAVNVQEGSMILMPA